jgi:hypothetical protein
VTKTKDESLKGVGLDIGTMNLVSARRKPGGKVDSSRLRDAFITLPAEAKKRLKLSGVNFIEADEDTIIVVGDAALDMANIFGQEARRPLSRGLISAGELDALHVLGVLVKNVLGDPIEKGEVCYFSVPAAPVDEDRDVVYHRGVFERIVEECGYEPYPSNEAMAIIFAETAKEGFSGLGMSFGSGMVNVALAINGVEGLTFSIARCLAEDFPVVTRQGLTTMAQVAEGDEVFDANGHFVPVVEKMDNGTRHTLLNIVLENLPAFPHRMTPDHRVFVQRRFGWEWVEAQNLAVGDEVGIPTIPAIRDSGSSYYFGRDNAKNVTVAGARNLGRFFGMFLGDGSCGGSAEEGPRFVQIAIDRKHQDIVEKYAAVCHTLFHREVEIVDATDENLTRVKLHITPVARHLRERFYAEDGTKMFPLAIENVSDQMALGIIEGLLDSDSHEERKRHTITNTSIPVVMLTHHLLNRFGVEHSIIRRPPRTGGVNSRGVQIEGRKEVFEIRVGGHVSKNLLDTMLAVEGHQVFDRFPDFATNRVSSVEEVPYGGRVWDIRVGSDHHSFASPGMLVHNCGDWIDGGAAKAVGSTASRMCALKERGIDLLAPVGREQEALALYYKALVEYTIDQVATEFGKVKDRFALPKPIPFILSGGTALAGNFQAFFEKAFTKKQRKFPIEVSEIRLATEPLNSVARGLLIQAIQEYEE